MLLLCLIIFRGVEQDIVSYQISSGLIVPLGPELVKSAAAQYLNVSVY